MKTRTKVGLHRGGVYGRPVRPSGAPRTGPARAERRSPPPPPRPRSRRSCPSTAQPRGAAGGLAQRSDSSRSAAERGPCLLGGRDVATHGHQPEKLQAVQLQHRASIAVSSACWIEACLARIVVDIDLEVDRVRARVARVVRQAADALRKVDRVDRLDLTRTAPLPGRLVRLQVARPAANAAPAASAALASASWTRFSPKVDDARRKCRAQTRRRYRLRDGRTSSTSAGSRPTRSQAAAIRCLMRSTEPRSAALFVCARTARCSVSGSGAGMPGCPGPRPPPAGRGAGRTNCRRAAVPGCRRQLHHRPKVATRPGLPSVGAVSAADRAVSRLASCRAADWPPRSGETEVCVLAAPRAGANSRSRWR